LKNPYTRLCMKEESILIAIGYSHDDRRTVCRVPAYGGCGRSR
jgi:glutamine synthetase